MDKYIKADFLIDDLLDYAQQNKGTYHEEGFKNAITVVEDQPTANVVERAAYEAVLEELCLARTQLVRERQLVRDLIREQGLRYEQGVTKYEHN